MLLLLFIVLVMIIIFEIFFMKRFILSPSVVFTGVFIISVSICLINYTNWNSEISSITFLAIISTIIVFNFWRDIIKVQYQNVRKYT